MFLGSYLKLRPYNLGMWRRGYKLRSAWLFWIGGFYMAVVLSGACGEGTIEKNDFDLPPASKKQRDTQVQDMALKEPSSERIPDQGEKPKAAAEGTAVSVSSTSPWSSQFSSEPSEALAEGELDVVGLFGDCITSEGVFPQGAKVLSGGDYASSGQVVRMTHRRLESASDLQDTLELALKGKTEAPSWRASAQWESFKGLMVTHESRWYFYMVEVENPLMMLRDVKLSLGGYRLYLEKGAEAFSKRCGEEFTEGYQTGGYLLHVIRMSKKTQASQKSLDQLIKASGFGFNARGMVEVDEEADLSELDVDIHTKWQGGRGVLAHTTLKDLRRVSEGWPKAVAEHGVLIRRIKRPFSELTASLHSPHLEHIIAEIRLYNQALDRLSALKERLLHPPLSSSLPVDSKKRERLENLMRALSHKVEVCKMRVDLGECQDMELLLQAKNFRLTLHTPHPSCGVLVYHKELRRDESCGEESYQESVMQEDPRCPVAQYKRGKIFEKEITLRGAQNNQRNIKGHYPKMCLEAGVERGAQLLSTETKNTLRLVLPEMMIVCGKNPEKCPTLLISCTVLLAERLLE